MAMINSGRYDKIEYEPVIQGREERGQKAQDQEIKKAESQNAQDRETKKAEGQNAQDRETKKIGIMGGTFNPIHNGHLIIAEDVREKAGLDRVLFIPSGQPPHKPGNEVADAEHRFEMVRLAVSSNRYFEASRIEVDRNGPTYTINTLQELREKFGEETQIYYIIGADVVNELLTWRECEKVFRLCEFIAVMRPGFDETGFYGSIRQLSADKGARINPVPSRLADISSTDIRERCRTGRSIKYLVPGSVEKYIIENGLYKAHL